MSEQKIVKCRCGRGMKVEMVEDEHWHPTYNDPDSGGTVRWRYECTCGWLSPVENTREAAYLAATATPPNPLLTLPELFKLEDDDAVWVVSDNGKIWAMGAEYGQEWASEENCLFFAAKPTPDDIAAAKAGRGQGE